jgi:hypothetical protein
VKGFRPPARLAPDRELLLASGWFLALALLVAGPLLGRGYLLLLDFAAGPHFAKLDPLPLPSSGDLGNEVPLFAVQRLLAAIYQPFVPRALLVFPIVLGGVGVYRLTRRLLGVGILPALAGGTLYMINPFMRDRYLAGHLYFVLGCSLLPWALLPLYDAARRPTSRRAATVALWWAGLAAVSIHVAGMYALLIAAAVLFMRGRVRTRAAFAATTAALGAALCVYWMPASLVATTGGRVGVNDLTVYETRPGRLTIVPTLVAMYGFWRREFGRPADQHPWLYLLVVPILAAVVAGGIAVLRGRERRFGGFLAVTGGLALVLAAGTALPPTAGAFRWLFLHVSPLKIYREPQKLLGLTVLAYGIFAAVGVDRLLRRRSTLASLAAAAVSASVLGYGYSMFWGLSGAVALDRFPSSWAKADTIMARTGPGRLLFLPWRLYDVWTFTDGRIVANPAKSYFTGREVLAGDNVGFTIIPTQSPDPFSYYIEGLLARRSQIQRLGRLLAPLDVRFVAWSAEGDFADYELLARQRDLRLLYLGPSMALFENRAWRGRDLQVAPLERPPRVARVDSGFPPVARVLPIWRHVQQRGGPAVSVGERCTDGWRLGDQRAGCHLGAVASFAARRGQTLLWRPLAGVRIVGYVASALTLVLIILVRLRRP